MSVTGQSWPSCFFIFDIIKSPKQSGFTAFLIIIFLFLSAKILSRRVLSNHWMDFSEILGYDRYGYEVVQEVSKFKTADPVHPLGAYKNPPKFCLDEFSVKVRQIFLKFGKYDRYQYEVLQEGVKGSPGVHWGHTPPLHFMKGHISQKPFRSPHLNHIYSCSL